MKFDGIPSSATHTHTHRTTTHIHQIFHSMHWMESLLIRHKIRRTWNESLVLFLRRRRLLLRHQLICCVLKVLSTERARWSIRSFNDRARRRRALTRVCSANGSSHHHSSMTNMKLSILWSTIQWLFFFQLPSLNFDNWIRWKPCDFYVSVNIALKCQ